MKHTVSLKGLLGALAVVVGLACAHTPKPEEQLGQTEAAIRSAQEVGSSHVPQAALEVQLAQEELQHARDLIKNDDNDQATLQLMRAKADAELAIALSRQTQAQADARAAQDQLHAVQSQTQGQ